ncbi:MAG: sugar ABC transporter ATP-binding protein [Proteobacteria bacterium]|nr:sugar ABC transporter ATP-binding protein [Pseudomonadota bacterium]
MLRAEHLTKRFGSVTALADVSFDLRAGEIHALCGENGAGKSTLIKLLSGVHPHGSYQGRFELDGREANFASIRDAQAAGIAVIYQELSCIDEMSVAENLFLGRPTTRYGVFIDRGAAERRAAAALARFGVSLDPAAPMRSLGIGQKQLVEIIKALLRESRILILDEPTAALAEHEVEVLLAILRDLRASGIGLIYISHRLEELAKIADRVTVLRDGATVASMPIAAADPATLVRHMVGRDVAELYPTRTARRGPPLLQVRDLSVAAAGSGIRIEGVSFDLHAGEVLGIGGLMGAGRTELLSHLYGAWGRRSAGRVTLDGHRLDAGGPDSSLRAGLALVTEDRRRYGLCIEQSIGFNLSLSSLAQVSRCGVVSRRSEALRNDEWFSKLGVHATGLDAVVGRLSGGNQQKVVLGKALMTAPKVVMLDEPTRGIDVGAKMEIYALINTLTESGCAVLLVSSELPELIGVSDRILMLHDGRVTGTFSREQATPEVLMKAALGTAVVHTDAA